jgi:predicted  nucleic acid-binding Zn-ribbon protein
MTVTVLVDIGPNLITLGAKIVATLADFNAAFANIDTKLTAATTSVAGLASEIADLKTKITAGGMTAAEEDQALAALATKASALDSLQAALDAAK